MNPTKNQPEWLVEIQNNSWNPELIISGFSIVILYQLSDHLSEYVIALIQESQINIQILLFAVLYGALALTSLKLFFTIHLLLRGVWVGLVGLNYVFPDGVKKDKLPKVFQANYLKEGYRDIIDLILLLERICSSIFSVAFIGVGVSFSILFLLVIAIVLNLLGVSVEIILISVVVLVTLSTGSIYLNSYLAPVFKKEELKAITFFYKPISAINSIFFVKEPIAVFQTNLNKKVFFIAFPLLFAFLGFQTSSLMEEAGDFIDIYHTEEIIGQKRNKADFDRITYSSYEDRASDSRIKKARINSFFIQDYLKLQVADYRVDDKSLDLLNTGTHREHYDLLTLTLDGEIINNVKWFEDEVAYMNQRCLTTFLKLDTLKAGSHRLSIDKIIWNYKKGDTSHYEHWVHIPFIANN